MNFWILAVALLVISAAVISWPLFAGSARERITGMLLLLIIPLAGLVLYQQIGNPMAINPAVSNPPAAAAPPASVEDLIAKLQQRLTENPDDTEGWVILGRSLKTMRHYAGAETALANANRLLPHNPLIMVELAEAKLFASGKPEISAEILQLLESAVAIDPRQQKGLWLLGMAAAQHGDDGQAIALWQKLLIQVDPASDVGQSVTRQIELAQLRTGQAKMGQSPTEQGLTGFTLAVNVALAEELAGPLPESAILFIFIRPAGEKGMPLAVKRIETPQFPLSMTFSNADLLRPGNSLENFAALEISARISMTGVANIASGDYQAGEVKFDPRVAREIALHICHLVP